MRLVGIHRAHMIRLCLVSIRPDQGIRIELQRQSDGDRTYIAAAEDAAGQLLVVFGLDRLDLAG